MGDHAARQPLPHDRVPQERPGPVANDAADHGSVAKLVNDLLPERREELWRDAKGREYFDGCIRDEKQARLAYRYTLSQAWRHRLLPDGCPYAHTKVNVELNARLASH